MKKRKKEARPKQPTQAETVRAYIEGGAATGYHSPTLSDSFWSAKDRNLACERTKRKSR